MHIYNIMLTRRGKYIAFSALFLFFSYIGIRYFVFKTDQAIPFLSSVENSYLLIIEKAANSLLYLVKSKVTFENHIVVLNDSALSGFIPTIRFKKWMALFLFLVWITKTTIIRKLLFSSLLVVLHFVIISVYLAVGAILTGSVDQNYSMLAIPVTLGLLCLITLLIPWYRKYKESLISGLSKLKFNAKLLENDLHVILMIYIFIIASNFLFVFFEYRPWVNFLFTSSQKILALLGFEAFVEPNYLIGANGSISMAKGCLGFQTMLLFAIVVLLTGTNNKIRWIYLVGGLLFLNFVNVMRFVFLFIYIQNHESIDLAADIHDTYNYITYFVVFLLWVIWFEMFADTKQKLKRTD